MDLLISIKPKYVEKIKNKSKIYEFRKTLININNINQVYIYETAPVKRITAVCKFKSVLQGTPKEIWNTCNKYGGISKKDFFEYFKNKQIAYAYEIEDIKKVNIELKELKPNNRQPQSYFYINKNF